MRWKLRGFAADDAACLAQELGLPSIVAGVLAARGIQSVAEARNFINPSLATAWSDPKHIGGLVEVCDALEAALRAGERICIFGDYDVDGITAAAIAFKALSALGATPEVVLPFREGEGYGLSEAAIVRILATKPNLLLTVDCGVSGAEEIAELLRRGVKVVVTDHHEASGTIPQGIPLADPKLDPANPAAILCGAGVALKLVALLGARFEQPNLWEEYLDLATLGTIADCMPLKGENRALVATGLKHMAHKMRPGIAASFRNAGKHEQDPDAEMLSYSLIPRLNAAGRVSDPLIAFDLLITNHEGAAERLAQKLATLNTERRELESFLLEKAQAQVAQLPRGFRSIVVGGERYHEGVKGIVANRLAREYGVPSIVFSFEEGVAVGSGRSVGALNLHAAVAEFSDMLTRFGGHQAAIGLTLKQELLGEFAKGFEAFMQTADPETFILTQGVDTYVSLSQLSLESVAELQVLQPFGKENEEPCFITKGLLLKAARFVGNDNKHLAFEVSDGERELSAIWFNAGIQDLSELPLQAEVVYHVRIDEWRGRKKVKLYVLDLIVPADAKETPHSNDFKATLELSEQAKLDALLFSGDREALITHLAAVVGGSQLTLRPAQEKCLKTLEQGQNTLAIMATGRGKSLIFQIHAAKQALSLKSPSLFIYPLRSLITDQEYILSSRLERIGLTCASLTGAQTPLERERIMQGVLDGSVHVVLTTPEFIFANAPSAAPAQSTAQASSAAGAAQRCTYKGRLGQSFWENFGFAVIDEAHHIATSDESFRPDYTRLQRLCTLMPQATLLALSATSDEETSKAISTSLEITQIVVDTSKRPNLHVSDRRGLREKQGDTQEEERRAALVELVTTSSKCLVYCSSRAATIELCAQLRKQLRSKAAHIAFYNAALTTTDRETVQAAFRAGELQCLIATSAFGEGIDIPDVRDVVLYHTPYSIIDFNQMAGRAGRDGKEATVHLFAMSSEVAHMQAYLAEKNRACALNDGLSSSGLPAVTQKEQAKALQHFELFADWFFHASPHELLSVIQRPLTPLEEHRIGA